MNQEHHLPIKEVAAASTRLRRLGWQSLFVPAVPGGGGGWSAGVAILARSPVAISLPPKGSDKVYAGRAVCAKVEAPGLRPFLAYSAYLRDGEGLSEANLEILSEVGAHIETNAGMPFVVGADFQNQPEAIARVGFAEDAGAVLVTSAHPRGTCRMRKSSNEIDFFAFSRDMARAVQAIRTVEGVGTRPHVPVRVQMYPRVTSMRALVLRLPPALPTERIVGPIRETWCWEQLQKRAEKIEMEVRGGVALAAIEEPLMDLFSDWADAAEAEVVEATGMTGRIKMGLRGKQPNLVWR